MSLSKTQNDPATVWQPQGNALSNLFQQGTDLLGQNQGAGMQNQMQQMMQQMMTPEGFQQQGMNLLNPMLQNINQGSVQAMNMGGSRQGVAQGQAAADVNQQFMSNLPQMFNLGMSAPWANLMQARDLFGGPTVLGGGGSSASFGMPE